MKNTCMHSRAQGSDADSTVPLYLPSTHWQLVEPVTVVKLCSGQDAHGSLLCPSLNVPLGHSVKGEANTYHSKQSASLHTAVCKMVVATVSIYSQLTRLTSELSPHFWWLVSRKHGIKWGQGSEVSCESNDNLNNHFANYCCHTRYPLTCAPNRGSTCTQCQGVKTKENSIQFMRIHTPFIS